MKIDKKTLIQLIVLLVLVVGAGYYFLYYAPANERIAALEEEKTAKENELSEKSLLIIGESQLDEDIISAKDQIEELSELIFVDLKLEEALKIMGKLNKDGKIVFDTVDMTESIDEEMQSPTIQQQLSFTADYYDVMKYLRAVRKYDKRIAISSGSFSLVEYDDYEEAAAEGAEADADAVADTQAEAGGAAAAEASVAVSEVSDSEADDAAKNSEDSTSGASKREKSYKLMTNIVLHYRSLPMLAQLGKRDEQLISDIKSTRELAKGPFSKYSDYLEAVRREAVKQSAQVNTVVPTFDIPVFTTATDADAESQYSAPRSDVTGFEHEEQFFVGSDRDVKGSLVRSLVRKSGEYAADLSFDFITAKTLNVASVVFEKEHRLNVQPSNIYMQVYAFETSNHKIGLVLLDSAGREYEIMLSESVGWTEWQEVSAALPDGITYPCVIQRIFVKGEGYDQKITGRYLFDQLEVSYPQLSGEY